MLFLFSFLPLALAIYYIATDEAKDYVLLAVSLLFYAIGSLKYFALFIFVIFFTVLLGRAIYIVTKLAVKKALLAFGIILNISLLGYYKYLDFVISTANNIFKTSMVAKNLLLPLGISFFSFKAISYLVDIYNRKAEFKNTFPIQDALYLSFFPQIQSGPLNRYADNMRVEKEKRNALFVDGINRFIIGFNKKIGIHETDYVNI